VSLGVVGVAVVGGHEEACGCLGQGGNFGFRSRPIGRKKRVKKRLQKE
jgi:hypothetical protein